MKEYLKSKKQNNGKHKRFTSVLSVNSELDTFTPVLKYEIKIQPLVVCWGIVHDCYIIFGEDIKILGNSGRNLLKMKLWMVL